MNLWARYNIEWKTLPAEGQEDYQGSVSIFGDSQYDAGARVIEALNKTKFKDNPRAIVFTEVTLMEVLGQED